MGARLVTLHADAAGVPFLAAGSPHAYGERRHWLEAALRQDLGPLWVEPATRAVRAVPRDEPQPHPEVCVPYQDANGLGFTLRPRLPLLFVKSRRGELLPDARTALAYARENATEFAGELAAIAEHAPSVLDPAVVRRHEQAAPLLFRDLAQPYGSFGHGFFAIPAGLYAVTEPGTGTFIAPPVNRSPALPVVSGLIETDWHHHALFIVARYPRFAGRSLLVLPEQDLAQVYVVAYRATAAATVEHAAAEQGGEPAYEARWAAVTAELAAAGGGILARRTGVASVSLQCLHCRVSVTGAADGDLPPDHERADVFIRPYKRLQQESRQAAKGRGRAQHKEEQT